MTSAITRLAARLAADPQSDTADPNWSRVRTIVPGADIIVTLKGTPPATRYFVAADGSSLTVLNLTDPALPRTVTHRLRSVASNHPGYFTAEKIAFVDVDREIRVGPDGVFVAARRIADLEQIVERIASDHVVEISSPVRTRGSVELAVTGVVAGSLVGFLVSLDAGGTHGDPLRKTAILWLPVAAGLLGYHAFHHKVGGVIYRAP
jgi:hypothetical protein